MPRPLVLVALALTLLTGLVLGQLSALEVTSVQTAVTSDRQSTETARAFYAAINLFLETGDAGSVERFLAPGFVGHAAHAAQPESATELMRYLESLRATFPGLRLEASGLSAQSGTVAVDLKLVGEAAGSFAGVALDAVHGAIGYEVLRFEGDQIVERWASRELPPLFRMLGEAEFPAAHLVMSEPRIERLALEPNGLIEFTNEDAFIVVAEIGATTIQISGAPGTGEHSANPSLGSAESAAIPIDGEFVALKPGEAMTVPPQVKTRLANSGAATSTLLSISVSRAMIGTAPVVSQDVLESIGMERTMVVGLGLLPIPKQASSWRVSVGQVVLPPGAGIPRHAAGPAELIAVMSGAIEVTVVRQSVVWYQPGRSFVSIHDSQEIMAGQGMRTVPGAVVEYHAAGDEPATLWIVTIEAGAAEPPGESTLERF